METLDVTKMSEDKNMEKADVPILTENKNMEKVDVTKMSENKITESVDVTKMTEDKNMEKADVSILTKNKNMEKVGVTNLTENKNTKKENVPRKNESKNMENVDVAKVVNEFDKNKLWKIVKTVFLVLVWVCLGLYLEITGPTLIDLKIRTHSNYEDVATAISGRSVGYFIGSALGGLLVDKLGLFCDLMIAICLDGGAMATIGVPWVPNTELIWFLCCMQGAFEGVINIAGQKLIINMWQEGAASPLHVLHGGFGIGSFIIPLIANPFLAVPAEKQENSTFTNSTNIAVVVTTTSRATTTTGEPESYVKPSRIEYAYMIAAAITVCLSFVFYAYHFMGASFRRDVRIHRKKEKESSGETDTENKTLTFREMFNPATCAGGRVFYGLQIFVLLCLYFFNCVGGERVAGKFVRAFSIDQFGFSTDEGSYLNTSFWISFAVGRVLGFLTARWIPIRILILLETGGILVTTILLVIFGGNSSTALWVLMQPAGFFIAPLFPTGLGWGNFHIEITGIAITVILLGGSVGGVAYMKLIGYLYDHFGPRTFLYTLLGYGVLVFALAIILDLVGAQHGGRYKKEEENLQQDVKEGEGKEEFNSKL